MEQPRNTPSKESLTFIQESRAAEDMTDEQGDYDTTIEYITALAQDYSQSQAYSHFTRTMQQLSREAFNTGRHSRAEIPLMFVSKVFRDGFLLGLDANKRLIGRQYEHVTLSHFNTAMEQIRDAADGDASVTAHLLMMHAADEKEINDPSDPIEIMVDGISHELYDEDDISKHTMFRSGFQLARAAQIAHQLEVDEQFKALALAVGPIDATEE